MRQSFVLCFATACTLEVAVTSDEAAPPQPGFAAPAARPEGDAGDLTADTFRPSDTLVVDSDTDAAGTSAMAPGWSLVVRGAALDTAAMEAANLQAPGTYAGDLSRLEPGTHRLVTVELANIGTDTHSGYPGVSITADLPQVVFPTEPYWYYAIFAGTSYDTPFEIEAPDTLAASEVTLTFGATAMGCTSQPPRDCPDPARTTTLTLPITAP